MAKPTRQRDTAQSVVAFGVALTCIVCAVLLFFVQPVAAQDEEDEAGAAAPAPTDRNPLEPSRPNPFMPVAGDRQYSIRSFYGPTYPSLPMTMTVGFPAIERPITGLGVAGAEPLGYEPYMRCSAIIWNKTGVVVAAMQVEDETGQIQPYTVRPGDLVGNYVVEQITQDAVTLRDRDTDRRRTVRLESARTGPAPAGGAAAPAQPAQPARPPAASRGGGRPPVGLPRPPPPA